MLQGRFSIPTCPELREILIDLLLEKLKKERHSNKQIRERKQKLLRIYGDTLNSICDEVRRVFGDNYETDRKLEDVCYEYVKIITRANFMNNDLTILYASWIIRYFLEINNRSLDFNNLASTLKAYISSRSVADMQQLKKAFRTHITTN